MAKVYNDENVPYETRIADLVKLVDECDASQPGRKLKFDQFGLHTTLLVKTRQALYYTAGKDRLLTIVLTRDAKGKRHDQMFYCANLAWNAREILSRYARRWGIEVTFENSKQLWVWKTRPTVPRKPSAAPSPWPWCSIA